MTKEALIEKTLQAISRLPADKVQEISDFADFLLKQLDDQILQKGIDAFMTSSDSFEFLKEEEELYSTKDLKVKY
jgi:hypothetical protein